MPSVHRTDPPKLTAVAPAALATASASSSSSSSDTSDADRQPPGYSKNGISTLQIGSAKTVAESSLLLQEAEAVIASKGLATEDQAASSSDDHD